MCAAPNRKHRQSHPLHPNETGLGAARRFQIDPLHGTTPVPGFEFEITGDQRRQPRLPLQFPLRMKRVAGRETDVTEPLVTRNISSTGVYFLAPLEVEPDTPLELEIRLTDHSSNWGCLRLHTRARVVRVEPAWPIGWHGLAATFDEIHFDSDAATPRSHNDVAREGERR